MCSASFLLDIGKREVDFARNVATKLGLKPKMVFIRCSALKLPFKSEIFDLVSSFSVLDHIPGKNSHQNAMKEMARVTRDSGYVVVTVPNKLFLLGTVARRIRSLMGDHFFETRFTPKQIRKSMLSVGLIPFLFDAKYPTKIGAHITRNHLPEFVMIVPAYVLRPFLRMWERFFLRLEESTFKMFGARMGYASQKTTQSISEIP